MNSCPLILNPHTDSLYTSLFVFMCLYFLTIKTSGMLANPRNNMYFANDRIAGSLTNKNKRMYQMTKISVALVTIAFIIAIFMAHFDMSSLSVFITAEQSQKKIYMFLGILAIWSKSNSIYL